MFQPFSKSAEQAAESAPGVGLGLALSRGLARQLGGEVTLEPSTGPGAAFILSLASAT
jgi:signal transduction histidine kinase